jgi:hypothetical protein
MKKKKHVTEKMKKSYLQRIKNHENVVAVDKSHNNMTNNFFTKLFLLVIKKEKLSKKMIKIIQKKRKKKNAIKGDKTNLCKNIYI